MIRPLPPSITDSHCHLDFDVLAEDLPGVLARARAAGVKRMVTIATSLAGASEAARLATAHEQVLFAAGVHPLHVATAEAASVERLAAITEHPRCVAIGETGLDYHYSHDNADAQAASLRIHIEAAQMIGLPLVIHARDADNDIASLLEQGFRKRPFKAVMHCFTGGERLARRAIDMGFYLSMSGIIAFPKSDALRRVFAAIPRDRILVETDSPYLAPPPHRGKRNEPAFVVRTAEVGAKLLGLDYPEFARLTEENFDRIFPRAARARPTTDG